MSRYTKIMFYGMIFWISIIAKPTSALPYPSITNELGCDLNPVTHGRMRALPKRNGDNGFSVKLEGQPEYYQPEKTYTLTLRSTHPVTFRGFAMTAMRADNSSTPAGSFKVLNPWSTKKMAFCNHIVTHSSKGKKTSAQFVWTAPPSNFGCVRIRTSVIQKGSIWFRDDGDLSFEICEATEPSDASTIPECCACGTAQYRMTFYGIWSPTTHPKDYPEFSTHWSNVIGASHSKNYEIWDYGKYATDGVRKVAEWGWPNAAEDEIRGQGDSVLSVIKTRAQWPAYQPRNIREPPSSVFDVDKTRHLVSLLSMLGPSPDWNVGITKESMCTQECGWEGQKVYDLIPWDAGTDSGVSYMSPNSPTNPPDKIRALTSRDDPNSPFYNSEGGPIPPVARVVLNRLSISGEQCGSSSDSPETSIQNHESSENAPSSDSDTSNSCMYSEWSGWNQCGVTCGWGIKVRSKMLKLKLVPSATCENQIMEKEICRGSGQCENEDENTVCLYSEWSKWSACTATCGRDALRFRMRTLKWPSEESNCHEPLKEMIFDCNTESCDSATTGCSYGTWSDWMPCSAQCGVGTTLRKRFAISGNGCESPNMETTKCMASEDCNPPTGFIVPDGCTYSPWTGWMPCPVSCGIGQTFRKRVLASSTPNVQCKDVQMQNTKCMTSEFCPESRPLDVPRVQPCMYSAWSEWMPCSVSCDHGETLRKRFLKSEPSESCQDLEMETIQCFMPPCRIVDSQSSPSSVIVTRKNCMYGPWSAWMPCSVSCGRGETLRKRFLKKSLDTSRICEGFEMETNVCTVPCSDQSDELTEDSNEPEIWSDWSSCSVTCGEGTRFRSATRHGCSDSFSPNCLLTETESCSGSTNCPIDCVMSEWGPWSTCSPCRTNISRRYTNRKTLRRSYQIRNRKRIKKPKFGGANCGSRKEKRKCVCA